MELNGNGYGLYRNIIDLIKGSYLEEEKAGRKEKAENTQVLQHFEENHQILTFFLENVHKMFIKVHIMFFISGHNSDNRYKKPSASYLNKVQQNAKVHISNSRFSHSYHILSISWAF